MRKPLLAALSALMLLSACGKIRDSRVNPMNWFGRSAAVAMAPQAAPDKPQDSRPLVAQVLTLHVEPIATGAIVRATGLPATQGYWDAELVARDIDDKGLQVFDFRLVPPLINLPASTQRSREVAVAVALSNIELAKISRISVQGANNALSSAR